MIAEFRLVALSTLETVGIVVGIVVGGASLIGLLLYGVGVVFPLRVKDASWRSGPLASGGTVTIVTAKVRSRTRNTQSITLFVLIGVPGAWFRFRHPRWRTNRDLDARPFRSTVPMIGNGHDLEVAGHDTQPIEGQFLGESLPFDHRTRLLIQGPRRRPLVRRLDTHVE